MPQLRCFSLSAAQLITSFSQVSGKGDAKKWKCSIYADMPDGPVVMMDWLAERGLDRKALGLLQANATAHEAYRVGRHCWRMLGTLPSRWCCNVA